MESGQSGFGVLWLLSGSGGRRRWVDNCLFLVFVAEVLGIGVGEIPMGLSLIHTSLGLVLRELPWKDVRVLDASR